MLNGLHPEKNGMTADPSPFDLGGCVALVTGASRGIGLTIAEALARAGADVALTSRSLAALEDARGRIEAAGRRVAVIEHDVGTVSARCRVAAMPWRRPWRGSVVSTFS